DGVEELLTLHGVATPGIDRGDVGGPLPAANAGDGPRAALGTVGLQHREGNGPRLATRPRAGLVHHDAEDPAPERPAAGPLSEAMEDEHPAVLSNLLGDGLASDVKACELDHRPVVKLHESEKGRLVSLQERGHDGLVARRLDFSRLRSTVE